MRGRARRRAELEGVASLERQPTRGSRLAAGTQTSGLYASSYGDACMARRSALATMATEDEECIAFRVSESGPSRVAAIFLVVVHPLAGRSSYNDLERLLKRLDLRRGECVYVCLHILPTCPRAVAKNANKLCARHAVVYHDAEYPLAAAAHALAGVELRPQDFVVVLRDVMPDADFIEELVSTVARLPGDVDLLTLTPSTYVGFAASASLLQAFASSRRCCRPSRR